MPHLNAAERMDGFPFACVCLPLPTSQICRIEVTARTFADRSMHAARPDLAAGPDHLRDVVQERATAIRRDWPRMVCTGCGMIGADARPNWRERGH